MSISHRQWKFQALTDIWTGDADQRGERLIPTSLLGSIRWWFEVLIRGLDGSACNPSFEDRRAHPESSRCPDPDVKNPLDHAHHCVVCELFGCTGWARKFRFQVLDPAGATIQKKIERNQEFVLRFGLLRQIQPEEWTLLDLTLRLIAEYGAMGGKTVFKPSDEPGRASRFYHQDFGMVAMKSSSPCSQAEQEKLDHYVCGEHWRRIDRNDFAWASLRYFWCVNGRYLARQDATKSTFNRVIGRPEPKHQASQCDTWLAGRRANPSRRIEPESKKVFSFKDPARTFGFVKPGVADFNEMKQRLRDVWPSFKDDEFMQGREVLDRLFTTSGGTP